MAYEEKPTKKTKFFFHSLATFFSKRRRENLSPFPFGKIVGTEFFTPLYPVHSAKRGARIKNRRGSKVSPLAWYLKEGRRRELLHIVRYDLCNGGGSEHKDAKSGR